MIAVTVRSQPNRPKPKQGDRRTTKKHGLQIRIMKRDSHGSFIVSGGRQLYEWVSPSAIPHQCAHLLTDEERAKYLR